MQIVGPVQFLLIFENRNALILYDKQLRYYVKSGQKQLVLNSGMNGKST